MTFIFIDTVRSGAFRLGVLGDKIKVKESVGRSHEILPALAVAASRDILEAADGICVVKGPGSYSAVRSGVLIANLLARWHKKPLYGVDVDEAQDLERLRDALAHGTIPAQSYVAPEYDSEPNITVKRTA
ncbi:MAG: hypothetical protein WC641_02895 [Patescibacteria group bacterium]